MPRPLSATSTRSFGTLGASCSVVARSTASVLRLRLLTPIRSLSICQRALELVAVMHLDQHVHAAEMAEPRQLGRELVVEAGHDQQDAVGTERPGLEDLVRIDHEVLAQRRQLGGAARLAEELVLALEVGLVGQHRQAGGATALVGRGERRRIEVRPDQALAGRGLLDLGDQPVAAGGDRGLQRLGEAARRFGRPGALLALALGDAPLAGVDVACACRRRSW